MATQIEKCCYVSEGLCIAKNINIELIWLYNDAELDVRLFEIFFNKERWPFAVYFASKVSACFGFQR